MIAAALQASAPLFVGTVFVLGLLVGSFLNVVIHRVPVMLERAWRRECLALDGKEPPAEAPYDLIRPRSACPGCKAPITALQNIPVLSWLVLRGRARFYGPGDVVLGEFGEREGILMPGGARYWFEKAGDGDLEILQIVAKTPGVKSERINVDGHKDWMDSNDFLKVYDSAKAQAG